RYVESLAVENPLRCDPSLARRAGVRAGVRRRFAGVQWFVYTSPQRKRGAAAVSTSRRDAWRLKVRRAAIPRSRVGLVCALVCALVCDAVSLLPMLGD
ncbi:MAG: hypothetical protein QF805_24325, partial [Pirellulaceae bacterium]|nr:hypothetical protein [Pirellulaceae bacterium]